MKLHRDFAHRAQVGAFVPLVYTTQVEVVAARQGHFRVLGTVPLETGWATLVIRQRGEGGRSGVGAGVAGLVGLV